MFDWYRYTYEDGYIYVDRDLSERSISEDEAEHGELIRKEFYGWF